MARARVEAAQAKVEMAGSAEKTAYLNLSYTTIKAPFSGVINRIHYRSGSLIDESNLLTSISDNKEVFAYFNVSENEYLKYISEKARQQKTDSVELILSNGSVHPYKGFIETIEGQFDNVTGNIAFRARFVNPERILKHGSSGKIRIYRPLKNAMLIPQKSTFELQDKIFVYTVDEDNKVQMTSCVPQFRIPHFYIIGSGLERDHLVIYEGIQELSVGTEVKPVKTELSALIARGITDQN
jgi:RND family efflux transporter MFP subunit